MTASPLAETIAVSSSSADFSLSKNGPPSSVRRSRRPRRGRPGYNSDHLNGGERRHSPSITSRSRSRSADMAPAAAARGDIAPLFPSLIIDTRRAEIDPLPFFQLFSNSDRRRDLETMRITYCVRRSSLHRSDLQWEEEEARGHCPMGLCVKDE